MHEESAFSTLEDSRARVDHKTNVVLIPDSLVFEALAKAPKSIRLYSRDHKNDLVLKGDEVYYGPGSTTPFILDRSGAARKPVSADLVKLARLVDARWRIFRTSRLDARMS